jgi:hypothetical protein
VSNYNNYSSASTSLVTIHKRNRDTAQSPPSPSTSPFFSGDTDSKKKRYKIIPNTHSSSSIDLTSVKIEATDDGSNEVTSTTVEMKIPEDRIALIKLIKSQLPRDLYSLFLATLKDYHKTQNFDHLMANLIICFSTRKLNYILKGMRRFVKDFHMDSFDACIANYQPSM